MSSLPVELTKRNMEEMKSRKKMPQPLLLLMHRGSYRSRKTEFFRQKSKEETLISRTAEGEKKHESLGNVCEQSGCDSPTCCQASPAAEGSFDPSWPKSPNASEKCASWMDKVTKLRRMSSFTSQLSPSELDSRPSWSKFSSSYTSWTRPVAGHQNSDSYWPDSDILDMDDDDMDVALSEVHHRRKSSADTCKDIEDIEDFELDGLDSCDTDENEVFTVEKGKDKRLSGVMSSPDMAYGSMNGSFDQQDGD